MAKKKSAGKRSKKVWTKEAVFADWLGPVNSALKGKRLARIILTVNEPKLLASIQKRLDLGDDYNQDRKNARHVARVVGRFCRELTKGTEVQLGVFEKVFLACQLHPLCPQVGKGGGKWCDI